MYKKNRVTSIVAAVIGLGALAAIGAWQFYLFAAFRDPHGAVDVQGGTIHLWLAIGIVLFVCLGGFLLFSRILRYDNRTEMHVTSQGHPLGVKSITKNV